MHPITKVLDGAGLLVPRMRTGTCRHPPFATRLFNIVPISAAEVNCSPFIHWLVSDMTSFWSERLSLDLHRNGHHVWEERCSFGPGRDISAWRSPLQADRRWCEMVVTRRPRSIAWFHRQAVTGLPFLCTFGENNLFNDWYRRVLLWKTMSARSPEIHKFIPELDCAWTWSWCYLITCCAHRQVPENYNSLDYFPRLRHLKLYELSKESHLATGVIDYLDYCSRYFLKAERQQIHGWQTHISRSIF